MQVKIYVKMYLLFVNYALKTTSFVINEHKVSKPVHGLEFNVVDTLVLRRHNPWISKRIS